MKERKYSALDLYNYWESIHKADKSRYTRAKRREALNELCDLFIGQEFEIDDLKMFKKKTVDFLVNEDGQKGRGKHKGKLWLTHTEEDFDHIVSENFMQVELNKNKFGADHLSFDDIISKWATGKFKSNSDSIVKEAHRINSPVYIMFLQDNFYG
jgi:tyrosyl-tRNA synthetase